MDTHQIFVYDMTTDMDTSCESSHSITPIFSVSMMTPIKFETTSSPNSPLSSHFSDGITLSKSQEQNSSSENLSVIGPSSCSSFDFNSSVQQISPSPSHSREMTHVYYNGGSNSQNTNCCQSMKNALLQIESTLMGPDSDEDTTPTTPTPVATFSGRKHPDVSSQRRQRVRTQETHQVSHNIQSQSSLTPKPRKPSYESQKEDPMGNLKILLIECARAISEGKLDDFERLIHVARGAVNVNGEPIQRLGAYLIEGLVARKEASGTKIYRSLRCRELRSKDLLSYMHILYEICPYMKFGYMAANGAIAEAFRNESRVHIIDFQIAQGTQWMTLIQALAATPSGPPHLRITGIDDPASKYARGGNLEAVGERLAAISKEFKIPLEFHAVPVLAPDVTREMLDVRPGEALAVNFPLQLHHIPDESVDVNNPRDALLRMVKSLSPKVVTLIEQESNTNTTPFLTRFVETLEFYYAMFESIDVTPEGDRKERVNVEQHCLAKDLVNIIACEGKERVERHELLGKWKSRFTMAGFQPFPLSSHVNSVIRSLLGLYSEYYTLVEKDGTMLLGWRNRNLISASAWH
ncbi:hypothetical protein GIB67_039922 [Kingdonia uniflora]|uniref:Chitin-inducible gibberellin-responsive protein 1 n=1 Tax=Kingdonia uniflora TaxID=39325 RepID=A0A7J7P3G6_9MAGN|nr:hypothetical protein GIB67_039922 [Kingdonia uniflora]